MGFIIVLTIIGIIIFLVKKDKEEKSAGRTTAATEAQSRITAAEKARMDALQHYKNSPVMQHTVDAFMPVISEWVKKAEEDASVKKVRLYVSFCEEKVFLNDWWYSDYSAKSVVFFNSIGYEDLAWNQLKPFADALRSELTHRCKELDSRIVVDTYVSSKTDDDDFHSPSYHFGIDLSAIRPASLKQI